FFLNSLEIHPFSISHDAIDPSGFTVKHNGKKIGIATDLGIVTSVVRNHLKNCSALLLEANHDPEMLISGSYPWHLKQRIKSRNGHLSNEDTKNLIIDIKHKNLSHIILGHLSDENNSPEKAFKTVSQAINNDNIKLNVASQYEAGSMVSI
ncbi:MBL fold metallo-hydrolase, partial [bacterium]|nr:MBL fold metallo-hydrolase [bacterium]